MQAEERQKRIEDRLTKVEFASLEELSELVDASISTIRRDLDILEGKGLLRRTHGGARLINPKSDEFTFSTRDTHQLSEKEAIGKACAELILPNQTVIVDAGTTCFHVARYLEAKNPHIITNSLPVANIFSSTPKLEVVVTGGVIYPRLGVLVGPLAVAAFSQIQADVAVMSCGGVTPDGVTNSHGLLIEIQRAMMQAASRVILCLDHTKFGRQSISQLCELPSIDTVITDQLPPPEIGAAFEKAGTEVIIASIDGYQILHPRKPRSDRRKRLLTSTVPAQFEPDSGEEFLD
jgi:DeoR/GlpR family transcriptional regulator of sugar metabolism